MSNQAILDIINIRTGNVDSDNLEKVSIPQLKKIDKPDGLPGRYAIVNNQADNLVIELDTEPDFDYNAVTYPEYLLTAVFYPLLRIFDKNAVSNYDEFSDYDETQAGFGGSWSLPTEYHTLLIEGVLAEIFPDLKPGYMLMVQQMMMNKLIQTDNKMPYVMGQP